MFGSCQGCSWQHPTALPSQSPPACRRQGQTSPSFGTDGGDVGHRRAVPASVPPAARRRRSGRRWAGAVGVTRGSGASPGTGGSFCWAGVPLSEGDGGGDRSEGLPAERRQTHGCEGSRWDAGPAGETWGPPQSTLPVIKPPIFVPRMRPMGSVTFYKLSHDLSAHVPFFFSPFCWLCVSHPPCPDSPLRPRRSYPRLVIPTISDGITAHLTNTYRLCYARVEPPKETGKHGVSDIQDGAKPSVGCQLLILRCNSAVFLPKMEGCWCPAGSAEEEAFTSTLLLGGRKTMLRYRTAEMQQNEKPACSPPLSPPCDHDDCPAPRLLCASHLARCKMHFSRVCAYAACGGGRKL